MRAYAAKILKMYTNQAGQLSDRVSKKRMVNISALPVEGAQTKLIP